MLLYDDAAGAALSVAAGEARRLDAPGYGTHHVLLGLLRTRDPVTERLTDAHPGLTVDAVLVAVGNAGAAPTSAPSGPPRRPVPAPEFRQAMDHVMARWRPLVRSGQLRTGRRLGCRELWLAVLDPFAASSRMLRSLGADPDELRSSVLATMVPDGRPVPAWPREVPPGTVGRLAARLLGHGTRT